MKGEAGQQQQQQQQHTRDNATSNEDRGIGGSPAAAVAAAEEEEPGRSDRGEEEEVEEANKQSFLLSWCHSREKSATARRRGLDTVDILKPRQFERSKITECSAVVAKPY
ncbi:hypothetical protein OsJ_17028 [Oryza sativa Japonica Group]|uniref:Uncharacterized protein n=1 Tax=Oryza sativa subsp. japonica TaxID=39947 RepID=B9FMB3_ORYSJ|nr:hypothetical protein OsJ_17028 [Oryza sativa Japonica Group]